MSLIPWDVLTSAVEELDRIRVQLKEALALERSSRFYNLLRLKRIIGEEQAEIIGTVIELTEGYVIVYWPREAGIAIFPSNVSMRRGLHVGEESLLSLIEVSERKRNTESRRSGPLQLLTKEEKLALIELSHGLSNSQIGFRLQLSESTIKNTLSHAYRKLRVQSRTEAALVARDLNLTCDVLTCDVAL